MRSQLSPELASISAHPRLDPKRVLRIYKKRAAHGTHPVLVTVKDIRGELHAHCSSSDGSHSIEQMAVAARAKGYEYIGITDHSRSLKIARGLPVEELWKQIRSIDKLNERLSGIRILK